MSLNKNQRLISGARVMCECSLELPNPDPFSVFKAHRKGAMVLNVRGGSFYTTPQLADSYIKKIFTSGDTPTLKKLTLFPPDGQKILLGDISVRYLRLTNGGDISGMVLRFVNVSEAQMDLLNSLLTLCPIIEGGEEEAILKAFPKLK